MCCWQLDLLMAEHVLLTFSVVYIAKGIYCHEHQRGVGSGKERVPSSQCVGEEVKESLSTENSREIFKRG